MRGPTSRHIPYTRVRTKPFHAAIDAPSTTCAWLFSKNSSITNGSKFTPDVPTRTIAAAAAGAIRTPLQRHVFGKGGILGYIVDCIMYLLGPLLEGWKNPAEGASTTLVAALSPDLEAHPGMVPEHSLLYLARSGSWTIVHDGYTAIQLLVYIDDSTQVRNTVFQWCACVV